MNRQGQLRWPLWRRVSCVDCGYPLIPDAVWPVRSYTCRCGLRRDAVALETRVFTACWAAETARTGGRVRPYVLAAAWDRRPATRHAAALDSVTAFVSSVVPAPIEVLARPAAAPPGPATRQSTARQPSGPSPAPKGTPCHSANPRAASRRRPRTAPHRR
ncbi:hypothetical protein AB0M46_21550 [Dactylosporangium sp. NPDC051485]|uniref:hypothetical protein n=1 Tax=Dactylosporangium sp. NPDC051485 TaxID=3154846 RepID=UPI00342E8D57